MVRRDVRVDGNGRPARQGRQLQLRQLDHDAMLRRQLRQALDQRGPDVAAEDDRMGGIGREDGRDQRRGRRLALRSGDPDRRRRAEAQEQVRLGHERRRRGIAALAPQAEVAERVAHELVGGRELLVHRRRRDDESRSCPRRRAIHPGADPVLDLAVPELGERFLELAVAAHVVDPDMGPRVVEEPGGRNSGPGKPEDRHGPPAQDACPDVRHRQSIEIERPLGRHRRAHASCLIEARKRVTPRSPARIPTIQKRSVIFSSSQPASSK